MTTLSVTRNYHCKDVELLTASSEIVDNATSDLAFLLTKRPTWANPFFPNLKTRINNAFQTYLGVDNAKEMREKTQLVLGIMKPAKEKLSSFKIGVEEDFKNNKPRLKEILTTLGFTEHYKGVRNNDQEATIELLYKFSANMSPALQTEITTAGTEPTLITDLLGYADTLRDANVTQEFAKSQRPITSSAAVTEFNQIDSIIKSVCKISRNAFKDDKLKAASYSFAAAVRRLNKQGETKPPVNPN